MNPNDLESLYNSNNDNNIIDNNKKEDNTFNNETVDYSSFNDFEEKKEEVVEEVKPQVNLVEIKDEPIEEKKEEVEEVVENKPAPNLINVIEEKQVEEQEEIVPFVPEKKKLSILPVLIVITTILAVLFTGRTLLNMIQGIIANTGNNSSNIGTIKQDKSISITNKFILIPPGMFDQLTNNKYEYNYGYTTLETSSTPTCKFIFQAVNNYNNEDKVLESIFKYENITNKNIENKTVNKINWKNIKVEKEDKTIYYYVTKKQSKVYLLEYEISKNADSECIKYKDKVLESIQDR